MDDETEKLKVELDNIITLLGETLSLNHVSLGKGIYAMIMFISAVAENNPKMKEEFIEILNNINQ